MPVYTYACQSCESVIEKRQSFSDAPLTTCETCSGSLRRVIHPVGIVFKGSGWYVNDSRSSSNGKESKPAAEASADSGTAAGESTETKAETPKAEKSESAPSTPAASTTPSTPAKAD